MKNITLPKLGELLAKFPIKTQAQANIKETIIRWLDEELLTDRNPNGDITLDNAEDLLDSLLDECHDGEYGPDRYDIPFTEDELEAFIEELEQISLT